ncbi:helix-turn-helix transcriptional regulator [Desulfobacterales bacterium HSG17]|nr:helix-turn-helix transcriptional regulator [Desulfobacterales bacterium HSG17]
MFTIQWSKKALKQFIRFPLKDRIQISQTVDGLISWPDYLPNEVVKAHAIEGKSLIRAWREYKGMNCKDIADSMGISQSAYYRLEQSETPDKSTLKKVALVLEIDWRILTVNYE